MMTTPTATGSASGWPPICEQQQRETDHREHHLRQHDERHVDDDRRARHRAADPGTRQEARLDDVAADLEHRQQAVDRLADPARPEHRAHGRAQLAGEQAAPAERVGQHRQQVKRRHQQQAEAGGTERRRHLARAVRREQRDEQREPDDEPGVGDARNRQRLPPRRVASCRLSRASPSTAVAGRRPPARILPHAPCRSYVRAGQDGQVQRRLRRRRQSCHAHQSAKSGVPIATATRNGAEPAEPGERRDHVEDVLDLEAPAHRAA